MKISRKTGYILAGIAVFLFLFGNSGFRSMARRYWELSKLSAQLDQMKRENELLKKEIYLLKEDTSYIERIARRELGLISPGEVEYRFKD